MTHFMWFFFQKLLCCELANKNYFNSSRCFYSAGVGSNPKNLIKKGLNFDLKPFLSIASHSFVMST